MRPDLQILEHHEPGYPPRTRHNVEQAELTAAFAVDYSTAGERLTKKLAGQRYIAIELGLEPIEAARKLYKWMKLFDARVLNIAGNGMYTLGKHGWTQESMNLQLMLTLARVHLHWPISKVVSGGQTGADIAGIVAAFCCGIPAAATLPKGFLQRGADGKDFKSSEARIREEVVLWAITIAGEKP